MTREIIREIENFGECFIVTLEVQGMKVFKRFNRIQNEWKKNHDTVLAYNAETGICWEV